MDSNILVRLRIVLFVLAISLLSTLMLGCGGSSGGDDDDDDAPESYTLSGTIVGLANEPVEICNNQESPIICSDNGNFSLTAPNGSDYELSVVKNPTELLCRIDNGSGSNLQADVSDIQIMCEPVLTAATCTGSTDSDADDLTDCAELDTWGTNPWLQDTDGDSYLDNEEVAIFNPQNNRFVYNPRIADMALIAIDLTSLPQVDMVFTSSSSTSESVSTSHQQGSSSSINHDWGGENSQQIEIGHTQSISNTTTAGIQIDIKKEGGVSFKLENSLTLGFEYATNETNGSVVNWSTSEEQANSTTYEESLSVSEESGTEYSNGTLEITAKVRNPGIIPYDLENLTLTAFFFNPQHPFDSEPIGTLTYIDGDFPKTSILSGESPPLNFSVDVSLQKAQRLLRDSDNIAIMPATYRLLDADDSSIMLRDEDVSVRTASITIDYGTHASRQDKYRVATNNGDGSKAVSLGSALQDILGLTVLEGPGEWIYGDDVSATTTSSGLLAIGNYAMDTDTNQYWLLAHYHTTDAGFDYTTDLYHLLNEAYNLNDIMLRAGDKVTLVYVGDADRDGLSDRLERDYGTDPDKFDTDDDILMDAEEIYGWYTNLTGPPCDEGDLVRVYSNPLLADSDADGISDSDEQAQCTNPAFDFVALAGDDQFINRGSTMTLHGDIQSTTATSATYQWQLLSGPDVYVDDVPIRELSGREPSFTVPNEVSTLIFELELTVDGETMTDLVKVQVQKDRLRVAYVGDTATGLAPDGSTPYATLNAAFLGSPGMDVYVMSKSEPYTVQTVDIPDGISLFGGYDTSWLRDVDNNKTLITSTITQTNQPAVRIEYASSGMWFSGFSIFADASSISPGNNVIGFKVNGGSASSPSGNVYIAHSIIKASDVNTAVSDSPGSSYALMVNNVSRLDVENSRLVCGRGGNGNSGVSGTDGSDGSDGLRGTNGINLSVPGGAGGSGNPGSDGGAGGSGGTGLPIHWNGYPGANGIVSIDGYAGGAGGNGGTVCGKGAAGSSGIDGNNGEDGLGGGAFDKSVTLGFTPAHGVSGDHGEDGSGGGGGGGGAYCTFLNGGGGGGGGEAGTKGTLGTGGAGGGASIGIWIDRVPTAYILYNEIWTSYGGTGGNGSIGGTGGTGGAGGDYGWGGAGGNSGGDLTIANGGVGRRGGNGGSGGNGGGGSGGPSIGVYVTPGSAPILTGNTIVSLNGGPGGNYGNAGDGGHSYPVFDADIGDGQLPDISGGNVLTPGTGGVRGAGTGGGTDGTSGNAVATNF